MKDLSYLTTEYARRKDSECYDIEASYNGVKRWHLDLDGVFKQLTRELEQVIKQMKKGNE